ncbi:MAG: diguanylate cyclase [Oscillospiraceae bacterium]|nr:diguanylate cyclase [Oscillospiraceae bacterium]
MKNSILIVDDKELNLIFLNELLRAEYTIFQARDGMEAVEKANELLPDLVILDILMPGMDGYQVLTALKSSEATRNIPVIFISGLSNPEDEEKGLSLGTADYITKPFSAAIVRLRVGNQVRIINQMRAIERLSMTDQLTEIANRRCFDQRLSIEWKRAIRDQSPLSLMMLDADGFKTYNDTYGHKQGDVALRTIAAVLSRNLKRPADLVARWGGEEFAVLMPSTDDKGAFSVAESIRSDIQEAPILCPDFGYTYLTVSIGINTQVPSTEDSVDDFLTLADNALYRAKDTGKNRVCRHNVCGAD